MAPDIAFPSVADKNEFTKYCKFLAYKAVQVIVESRKGVKIEPNGKTSTSHTEWFNLHIPDNPDVTQATKNALPSDRILETFSKGLNIEISVKTEDGDEMGLEVWTLGLDDAQSDPSLTAMSTIYSKMSSLLKCLITISRVTPAYQLSRRQRSESFTIFYRVYSGEIKTKILGESTKKMPVGMLRTPRGGIFLSVICRTDLTIAPNKSPKNGGLLLKSDHFEMSPKRIIVDNSHKVVVSEPKEIDINKPLRYAAFVDEMLIKQVFEEFFEKYPLPKCTSRKPSTVDLEDSPAEEETETKKLETNPSPPKNKPEMRNENDPPLKLLYFPFADEHPIRELAEFYKDFFNAPHLKLVEEYDEIGPNNPDMAKYEREDLLNTSANLAKDLEIYENSVQEFDELLADMFRSTEWTGS